MLEDLSCNEDQKNLLLETAVLQCCKRLMLLPSKKVATKYFLEQNRIFFPMNTGRDCLIALKSVLKISSVWEHIRYLFLVSEEAYKKGKIQKGYYVYLKQAMCHFSKNLTKTSVSALVIFKVDHPEMFEKMFYINSVILVTLLENNECFFMALSPNPQRSNFVCYNGCAFFKRPNALKNRITYIKTEFFDDAYPKDPLVVVGLLFVSSEMAGLLIPSLKLEKDNDIEW